MDTQTEDKATIDKLRVDVRDVLGFLDEIDQNVRTLADAAGMQNVEIPALLATRNVLERVDKGLSELGREQ